jgi:hypothetical protein
MPIRLQIIVGIIMILGLTEIFIMVHRGKLNLKYALLWILAGFVVLMDIFPGMLGRIATALGIELPINMLFFVGFCFALLLVFGLTIKVSKMSDEVKRLTQELAILKYDIEEKKDVAE